MTATSTSRTAERTRTKKIGSLVAVLAALATSVLVAAPAHAADVAFADPALQGCVNQQLGQPANTPVSTSQAASITQLYCGGLGITSLEGVQSLTSAWDLSFYNNAITDLAPLSALTKITQLDVSLNQVNDLSPLASLTSMVYLTAGDNAIADLGPLSALTQMKSLNVRDNNITDLSPLSSMSLLQGLVINANTVSDLSPIAGLTQMAALYADDNKIADLTPLSGLANIFQLYLRNNEISDLTPLASSTSLQDIHVQQNHIADLSPLGGLPMLAQVHAYDQTISLPDVVVGASTPNPLREPHGAVYTSVTGGSHFALAADGSSWTYSAPSLNTITWNMSYPGPVWPAWEFSGTIQQRSIEEVILRPTTLIDDSATTPNTQTVTIDVLTNDGLPGEPALDPASLVLVDASGNTTTTLAVTGGVYNVVGGTITFTPTAGFSGSIADISYRVRNTDGIEGNAVIRVLVTAVAIDTPPTPSSGEASPRSETGHATLAITGGSSAASALFAILGALLTVAGASYLIITRKRITS